MPRTAVAVVASADPSVQDADGSDSYVGGHVASDYGFVDLDETEQVRRELVNGLTPHAGRIAGTVPARSAAGGGSPSAWRLPVT